ncbi:MAG: hypothetical protein A2V93_02850 [Ignavibacteria bacterium RBG_16_34_14]|nr:MAG: hypothetical protein A2V93_02850 [Ignavibacteria bacterium RBG_16_34_14]
MLISIQTENDKQKIRIKDDFTEKIKLLISENNLSDFIQIILLNDFQAERVNGILSNHTDLLNRRKRKKYPESKSDKKLEKGWIRIKKLTGGNFWIWGNIKERLDLENKYVFNLDARVTHAPISVRIQNPVEKALKESWARRIFISEKVELFGFKFTAELIYIAVNYVTGIAAYISYDPFTAFRLHENLLNELRKKFNIIPPNLKILEKNIYKFLSDESAQICFFYMGQRDEENAIDSLNKIFLYSSENYEGYLLKSIFEFSFEKDPIKALKTCKVAKRYSNKNGTWRYNEAFLLLYLKRFEEAIVLYKEIENYSYKGEDGIVSEVIDFNKNRLADNVNDLVSNFVLGFVYYKKKDNFPLAEEHFNRILQTNSNTKVKEPIIKLVTQYLKEINKLMGL